MHYKNQHLKKNKTGLIYIGILVCIEMHMFLGWVQKKNFGGQKSITFLD